MGKLTVAQKIARPVINFLVERYFPSGLFFYGAGPLRAFERFDAERKSGLGFTAATSLARLAINNNAARISVEVEGFTVNDEDMGDWRVTVERIATRTTGDDNDR